MHAKAQNLNSAERPEPASNGSYLKCVVNQRKPKRVEYHRILYQTSPMSHRCHTPTPTEGNSVPHKFACKVCWMLILTCGGVYTREKNPKSAVGTESGLQKELLHMHVNHSSCWKPLYARFWVLLSRVHCMHECATFSIPQLHENLLRIGRIAMVRHWWS